MLSVFLYVGLFVLPCFKINQSLHCRDLPHNLFGQKKKDYLHALYVQLEIPLFYHVKAALGLNLCDTLQILSMCLRSSFQNFYYILILLIH
jgi:hypothetical protein